MDKLNSSFEVRIRTVRTKEQAELRRVRAEADNEIRELAIEALEKGVSLDAVKDLLAISSSGDQDVVKQVEGDAVSPDAGKDTLNAIGKSSVS
jgi:hypothetical protein